MLYLTDSERRIMVVLARYKCATRTQLNYWVGDQSHSAIAKQVTKLVENDLLEEFKATPHIYRLSHAGCRVIGEMYTKRAYSFSSLSNLCHRNEVIIKIRNDYSPKFTVIRRIDLYKRGLNPGFGEHAATDGKQIFFLLIDDYLMGPERIKHAYNREHKINKRYYSIVGHKIRQWKNVADIFYICTTDKNRVSLHAKVIQEQALPFEVIQIKSLWREPAW